MLKAKRILAFAAAFMIPVTLCACDSGMIEANVNQNSNEYIFNEDCQNYLSEMSTFAQAENGYYFTSDSKLFYYDSQLHQAYPACDKAICSHSDSDCRAFLSPMKFFPEMRMFYYDRALYLVGREAGENGISQIYLYQISTDDFKQKKAAYLFQSTGGISLSCTLHRGYVYFSCDGGEMKETKATLFRTKLGDVSKNSPEKIYEFSAGGATIAGLSAYANNLFFNTFSYSDTSGNGYETVLNYINIHSLKTEQIPERKYSHFAEENRVLYFKDESTVNCFDLNSKNSEFFCRIKGPCYISADENYVYFDNLQSIIVGITDEKDRKIFVYDKSGKYITEIAPKNPRDDCYFGGNDIMLFKDIDYGEIVKADGANGYYTLDKSQLASESRQFTDIK